MASASGEVTPSTPGPGCMVTAVVSPPYTENWSDDQAFLMTASYYPRLPVQRRLGRSVSEGVCQASTCPTGEA